MLDKLHKLEKELPSLLVGSEWNSLEIDYHKPFVERVFCDWNDCRVYLHIIHKCKAEDALFHTHPWPSAMKVLSGAYEMGIGYGAGDNPPPIATKLISYGQMEYEMTDIDSWHYVRPLTDYAVTIMITGKPWGRSSPKANYIMKPLSEKRKKEILEVFLFYYPHKKQ